MDLSTLALFPSNQRSISVDTHLGNPIRNLVALPVDAACVQRYELLRRRHARWKKRKEATGVYNCFGLLFASRRTAIYDDEEVTRALTEDGYRQVSLSEVRAGDIALYREADRKTLLHGGLVVRLDGIFDTAASSVPIVLSKWNDTCGEDEHHFRDVPWTDGTWTVEFWTDRP